MAAAVEAMVEAADPGAIALLEPLRKDERTVEMADESTGDTSSFKLSELADDAIQALQEIERAMRGPGRWLRWACSPHSNHTR